MMMSIIAVTPSFPHLAESPTYDGISAIYKASPAERIFSSAQQVRWKEIAMKKYVIERNIPKVGSLEREQLKAASQKSNEALRQVGAGIQWQESYVADDKTFCVYLAENEALIHKHAELSGFPASKITEIKTMIDPTTGGIANLL
jgi:hypothetical protein